MSELDSLVSHAAVPGPQETDIWLAREVKAPQDLALAQVLLRTLSGMFSLGPAH